jgi:hypothetical protein
MSLTPWYRFPSGTWDTSSSRATTGSPTPLRGQIRASYRDGWRCPLKTVGEDAIATLGPELYVSALFQPTVSGPGEHFSFELNPTDFTGAVDGSGVPLPDPISVPVGFATLRRFSNGTFTDFASGPASFDVVIQ